MEEERLKTAQREQLEGRGPVRGKPGSKWELSLEKEERNLAIKLCNTCFLKERH